MRAPLLGAIVALTVLLLLQPPVAHAAMKRVDVFAAASLTDAIGAIARDWVTGVQVDYRVFSLETAHRNGDAIETGRESFGDWSARLAIAWQYGW